MCTHNFSKQCFKEHASKFLRPDFNRYFLTKRGVRVVRVMRPLIQMDESFKQNDISSLNVADLFFNIEDTYNLDLSIIDTDKIDNLRQAYDVFTNKIAHIRKKTVEKQFA